MAELSVQIGADVRDLLKKLDLTEGQLKKLDREAKRTGKGLNTIGGVGAKSMNKFGKSTANALPAMTEFSRVIQDAPFGIMGVGNNIQQLTANFGNLSKNAGGAGNALKLMVGALTGPAGILLAVSAVTSLLTVYGGELNKLIGKQSDLNEAFKDARESIGANISKLTSLTDAINDTTLSENERKKLYDKIKKEYPSFLGKLDLERVSRDKITNAIENERKAIIGLGITKALEAKKEPLYAQIAEAELKSAEESLSKTDKAFIYGIADPDTRIRFRKELAAKNKKAAIDDAEKSLSELNGVIKNIVSKYGVSVTDILNLGSDKPDNKASDKIKRDFVGIKNEIQAQSANLLETDTSISSPAFSLPPVANEEFLNSLQSALTQADILTNAISNSFGALGQQISSSLETGVAVVDAFVGSIVQSLTQLLAQMVTQAITQAIIGNALATASGIAAQAQGVQIATQSAAALGPFGAIALPGLLASTQGLITGALALAKVPKFATGGFSGDNNLAFLNKDELVLRPFEQSMLLNALRGSGISNNSVRSDSDYGIVGEVVLRGQNQVIQMKRANKKMSRYYNS